MFPKPDDYRLCFLILGSLEAWADGERLRLGGPLQERVLLMLLLEANHVVPVSRLIEAAWEEDPPATATHQIRKIVAELRRRLPGGGDLILTDGPGYRITLAEEQLDLSLFGVRTRRARTAVAAGLTENAVAELRGALDLWRGPVLGGCGSAVIESAGRALEERRLAAAEQLLELRSALGEGPDLIGDLRALILEHPLRESLRGQLMLALYRAGRQAEALAEYTLVRRLLAEELGIDPGPALDRMYAAILHGSPELEPTTPVTEQIEPVLPTPGAQVCSLPYDLPDFTGRAEEVAAVLSAATNPSGPGMRMVVFDGMGGSGKTALAIHTAHRLREHYPDGQLYIDLNGFTPEHNPLNPHVALDTLLRTLGVPGERIPDDESNRAALWRIATAPRKLLILLDNALDEAHIRPLLPGASGCLVLITSRSRLVGLDGAVCLPVAIMSRRDSLSLLARTIGPDRVRTEQAAAVRLIQLCGRLPLALRICAARLRSRPQWTLGYLVERLRDESRILDELSSQDRSVAVTIRLSLQALDPRHQAVFGLLGRHPGTDFDRFGAAALTGMSAGEVENVLELLLDMRLLEQHESDRYVFHDLVRSFARADAGDCLPAGSPAHGAAGPGGGSPAAGAVGPAGPADPGGEAVERLLDYYTACAARAAELIQPGRVRLATGVGNGPWELPVFDNAHTALTWFQREQRNLLVAIELATARRMDRHAFHLSRDLAYYCNLMGFTQEALETAEVAVHTARKLGDRELEGLALTNRAIPYWNLGRISEALESSSRALEIATEIGDDPGMAACLSRIGSFRNSLGDYAEGLRCHRLALDAHRAAGDRHEEASTLLSISSAQEALGRYPQAIEAALGSVRINTDLGALPAQVMGLVNLTNARLGLGDCEAALADLEEARALSRKVGAPGIEATVLACSANAYLRIGRIDRAYEYGVRALNAVWSSNSPMRTASVENILGSIHLARAEYSHALSRYTHAHRLAEAIGFRIELTRALEGIGRSLLGRGETEAAHLHLRHAWEHYAAMDANRAEVLRALMADEGAIPTSLG